MMDHAIAIEENSKQNLNIYPNLTSFFGLGSSGRFHWDDRALDLHFFGTMTCIFFVAYLHYLVNDLNFSAYDLHFKIHSATLTNKSLRQGSIFPPA